MEQNVPLESHAILEKCQDGSISFAEGLTEIVSEASQAAMGHEQVQQVIAYFTEQYERIRGSLSYN